MSAWQNENMVEKITKILEDYRYDEPQANGGQPYMTAYQLALVFTQRHADVVKRLDLPVGGKGTGQYTSLAQYLARQLAGAIKAGRVEHIEYAFVHTAYMRELRFQDDDHEVVASAPGTRYDVSIYRLKS